MLTRSSRVVIGSREKAKEMHSSLALQPSRKVQRGGEEGVDMPHVIRTLRARGVGAHCASTARGLDALVAEVIELCDESAPRHAAWLGLGLGPGLANPNPNPNPNPTLKRTGGECTGERTRGLAALCPRDGARHEQAAGGRSPTPTPTPTPTLTPISTPNPNPKSY